MITFKRISIQHFKNIASLELDFDSAGVTVITGPNGVGKSSIFGALYWAIFGKSIKGSIIPWEHTLPKDYKGVKVTLHFTKGSNKYTITRAISARGKHSVDFIGGDSTSRYKKDTQQAIESVIGCSPALFKHSILFGQKMNRFIEEDSNTQKAILEEIFDLDFLKLAQTHAESFISEYNLKLRGLIDQSNKLESDIESLLKLIEVMTENLNSAVKVKNQDTQDRINQKKSELSESRASLVNLHFQADKLREVYDPLQKSIDLAEENHRRLYKNRILESISGKNQVIRIGDLEKEAVSAKKAYDTYLALVKAKEYPLCLNCNRPHTEETVKTELSRLKSVYQNLLTTLGREKAVLEVTIRDEKKLILELDKLTKHLDSLKNQFSELELQKTHIKHSLETTTSNIAKLKGELRSLKASLGDDREDIVKLKKSLAEAKTLLPIREAELSDLSLKIASIDFKLQSYLWVKTHALSNSGLKTFIFDRMVKFLTSRMFSYAPYINQVISVRVNQESARRELLFRVADLSGNTVPIGDLSGGQSQLINIVIALSVNDFLDSLNPMNIFLLDEVYESLDDINIETVTNILAQKSKNKAIYIITHIKTFSYNNAKEIRLGLDSNKNTVYK